MEAAARAWGLTLEELNSGFASLRLRHRARHSWQHVPDAAREAHPFGVMPPRALGGDHLGGPRILIAMEWIDA
jgi:hypothetical protein